MKPLGSGLTYHPFEGIKELLEKKSISLPRYGRCEARGSRIEEGSGGDEKLFAEAMEGVKPISRENCGERRIKVRFAEGPGPKEDAETMSRLMDLVNYGTGFHVYETPEYIEGTGYHVHPEIARRLHRGEYSIQAHVDLHGLTAHDARETFENFMRGAVITGKSGLLIIHGRGLSSPAEPVLKKKVVEWLTRGPWRKWVMAYCSARACDGGAGATYVLLRRRPASKRSRRRVKSLSERQIKSGPWISERAGGLP